jgi:hypothetical protein
MSTKINTREEVMKDMTRMFQGAVKEAYEDLIVKAVAEERNKIAEWMMKHGYATGHGDTVVDLLTELEWQAAEKEREACAKLCEEISDSAHALWKVGADPTEQGREIGAEHCAQAIRARGEK